MTRAKECKTRKEAEDFMNHLHDKYDQPVVMSPDYWLNSQLSVARHFGGMTLNNVRYVVEDDTYDLVMEYFHLAYLKWVKPERLEYLKWAKPERPKVDLGKGK